MTTTFVGTTFRTNSQWHWDENQTIAALRTQIDQQWPNDQNLFINTTWFGPQFDNGEYDQFLKIMQNYIIGEDASHIRAVLRSCHNHYCPFSQEVILSDAVYWQPCLSPCKIIFM